VRELNLLKQLRETYLRNLRGGNLLCDGFLPVQFSLHKMIHMDETKCTVLLCNLGCFTRKMPHLERVGTSSTEASPHQPTTRIK